MKKSFLMLASWLMLMYGSFSFTSCKDDDNDDDAKKDAIPAVVEKHKGQKGASVDGDDVVYGNGSNLVVYHFSDNKIEKITVYQDCGSTAAAESAYKQAKESGNASNVQISGTIISFSKEIDKDIASYNKQNLCDMLNGKKPSNNGGEDENNNGGDENNNGGDDENNNGGEENNNGGEENNNGGEENNNGGEENNNGTIGGGDDNNGSNDNNNGGNDNNGGAIIGGGDENNDDNNNGNETNNSQSSIVGTWVLDENASVLKVDGEVEDEYEDEFGQTITFNADGTIKGDDGMTGTYSLNGNDLTIEYTEDGETTTLKKGTMSMSEEDIEELKAGMEEMGIPSSVFEIILNAIVANVDEFSASVNGDKLTINYIMTTKLDKSKLGVYAAMASDEMIEEYSTSVENKMVFNRK